MRKHADLTVDIMHWGPVRVRHRSDIPERIAFEPMMTPVRIRAVDPDALEMRQIPVELRDGRPIETVTAHFMEGKLWRRIDMPDGSGWSGPESLERTVGILRGASGMAATPFGPRIPSQLVLNAYYGHAPIPARTLARASLDLRGVAEAKVRSVAERGMVHDGRSVLVEMDHPLMQCTRNTYRASVKWRDAGMPWHGLYRHDRPDDPALVMEDMRDDDLVPTRRMSEALSGPMAGVAPRDDDIRYLVIGGSFMAGLWAATRIESWLTRDASQALGELCARASIDAVEGDPLRHLALLRGVVAKSIGGMRDFDLMHARRGPPGQFCRFVDAVAGPRLAPKAVPGEDVEALGGLAP